MLLNFCLDLIDLLICSASTPLLHPSVITCPQECSEMMAFNALLLLHFYLDKYALKRGCSEKVHPLLKKKCSTFTDSCLYTGLSLITTGIIF